MSYQGTEDDISKPPVRMFLLGNFPTNHAELGVVHKAFLGGEFRSLLQGLDPSRQWTVHAIGECSYTGSAAYNMDLSKRRADAVLSYLFSNKIGAGLPNVTIDIDPEAIGFAIAAKHLFQQPGAIPPPNVIEKEQGKYRAVILRVAPTGSVPPNPSRPKEFRYQIRVNNQISGGLSPSDMTKLVNKIFAKILSLSPEAIEGLAKSAEGWLALLPIGLAVDFVNFEIRDVAFRLQSKYRYVGVGVSLGIPLGSIIEFLGKKQLSIAIALNQFLVKISKDRRPDQIFQAVQALITGVSGVVVPGPWNPFVHQGGSDIHVASDRWEGEAEFGSTFVPFVNSWSLGSFSFGGRHILKHGPKAFGFRAVVEPFNGGDTIGLPQASSTGGTMTKIEGPFPATPD